MARVPALGYARPSVERASATLFLLAGIVLASPRGAQGAPPPSPRPHVVVVIIGQDPNAPAAEALRRSVREAVVAEGGIELVDPEWERTTFAAPRPEAWQGSLQKAQRLLSRAETDLKEFDLKSAEANIAQVAQSLEPYQGLREAVAIDKERIHLAVAIAHAQRNDKEIDRLLLEYTTRYPGQAPPEKKWPPDLFQRLAAAAPTAQSSVEISADPPGEAFVDGRSYGTTPVVAKDVPPGRHRVEVEAPGCFPAQVVVETQAQTSTPVALLPVPNISLALAKAKVEGPFDPPLGSAVARWAKGRAEFALLVAKKKGPGVELRALNLASQEESPRYAGDATPTSLRLLIGQWRTFRERRPEAEDHPIPTWAYVGAGAGAAALSAGVLLRLVAVGTENELQRREGAVTQAEAYDLHDRAGAQAVGGSLLVGVGVAALVGVAGFVVYQTLEATP